jgi:3-oxoacyl-[acyl-carrier-protein] synthase-1
MQPRVFVTGVGIISAIGNGIDETLHALTHLQSGIGELTLFDSLHARIPVAEVKLSNRALATIAGLPTAEIATRNTLLALVAAREAIRNSGWQSASEKTTGLAMATTVGGMDLNEQYYEALLQEPEHKDLIDMFDSADCTEKLAAALQVRHHITTVSTACSSSANSIMLAARIIKSGKTQRMIAGGVDALTRFTLNGFYSLEILSTTGCKPFDKNRNGLTIGEGAAILVLESEEVADASKIICEVSGWANVNEAFHATASSSEGTGAQLSMVNALNSAALRPADISYINAHGTGTEINDLSEGRAITAVFHEDVPPVSSTKGFTGHTLGAAGAIEAVFSILALQKQWLLPCLRCSDPMPELAFHPQKQMQSALVKHVMSNSFGFGGSNTTLIFSKV